MKRWFLRLPNAMQFVVFLAAILLAGGLLLERLQDSIIRAQALQRARDTASLVEAYGKLASSYKGMWAFVDPADPASAGVGDFLDYRLAHPPAPSASGAAPASSGFERDFHGAFAEGDMALVAQFGAFVRKNPSLLQRELSDEVERGSSRVKFRLTSDHFFNPRNAPNRFELAAIDAMHESATPPSEYWEVKDGSLRFARRLVASPACMSCHDTPQRAPAAVRTKFGNSLGFGYQEGGTAGVISVTVPLQSSAVQDMVAGFGTSTWLALAALCVAVAGSLFWFTGVTGSMRRLAAHMQAILHAREGQAVERLELDREEETSHNEIHRVSLGIRALHQALRIAQRAGHRG